MNTPEIKTDFLEPSIKSFNDLKEILKIATAKGQNPVIEVCEIELKILTEQKELIKTALIYAQNSNAFDLFIDDLQTLIKTLDNGK